MASVASLVGCVLILAGLLGSVAALRREGMHF
jgi:hypothetical protein